MGGKVRVHELAQEFGVTSKEILARLNADGESVRSASSTIEAPVARRLRESFGSMPPAQKAAAGEVQRRPPSANPTQPKAAAGRPKHRKSPITPADAFDISWRYRLASASENPTQTIDELSRECEAKYGLSRKGLRGLIAKYQRDIPVKDLTAESRRSAKPKSTAENHRSAKPSVRKQGQKEKPQRLGPAGAAQPPAKTSDGEDIVHRPRARIAGLPQVVATMDVEAIADIVAGNSSSHNDTKR